MASPLEALQARAMNGMAPNIFERIALMEQHLLEIARCSNAQIEQLSRVVGSLDRPVRLSVRQSEEFTLTGATYEHAIANWKEVVAISAYVTGAPLSAPGISLQFDDGSVSPTFQQALSGPISTVQKVSLNGVLPAGQLVVVQTFTSWVGGWMVW